MSSGGGQRQDRAEQDSNALHLLPVQELRALRAERKAVGAAVSYLRRLTQGRLDIVRREVVRRDAGQTPASLSELVAALPETLGHQVVGVGPSRTARLERVDDPTLVAELDAVCPPTTLTHLPELGVDELHRLRDDLTELEARVSERRRALFDELDSLSHELARRYREGEASIDDLLAEERSPR